MQITDGPAVCPAFQTAHQTVHPAMSHRRNVLRIDLLFLCVPAFFHPLPDSLCQQACANLCQTLCHQVGCHLLRMEAGIDWC